MKKQSKEEIAKEQEAKKAAAAADSALAELQMPKGAEEVDSGDVETVLRFDKGDTVTGIYQGCKDVKNKTYNSIDRLHKIIVDGEKCGIWGTQTLDGALEKVRAGEKVWIGYAGKTDLAGGNTMHVFKVAKVK